MFFNLGDKELLVVVAVFLFVTIGVSGLAAFSMGRVKRWWKRGDKEDP